MSNHKQAVQDIHDAAAKHGLDIVALVLETEDEAFVACSSIKQLITAKTLIALSLDNVPDEVIEKECDCPNCSPKENKFFELMHESFPGLLSTMPDDIKQEFVDKFKDKSDKSQERLFEKTFSVLQMMNKLLNK